MNSSVAQVCIIIISIFTLIYIIKNNKEISSEVEKVKKQKNSGIITIVLIIGLIILGGLYINNQINNLYSKIKYVSAVEKNNKAYDIVDNLIKRETEYYNLQMSKKYEDNYSKPYMIPEFKHLEGDWCSGFVISDENGNEFVWIPISNTEKDNVAKLQKKDFIANANIQKEYCLDDNYEDFIKSSLENGGFYISRYEIGIEDGFIVSKANKKLLTNLNKNDMKKQIDNMYVNKDFSCELINGYAYDSTIDWLTKNNEVHSSNIDITKEVFTGRNSIKNIFDMFDNIFEFTRRR